jgi:hypothetical protein
MTDILNAFNEMLMKAIVWLFYETLRVCGLIE